MHEQYVLPDPGHPKRVVICDVDSKRCVSTTLKAFNYFPYCGEELEEEY